jgi:hypothetical protein
MRLDRHFAAVLKGQQSQNGAAGASINFLRR